MGLKTESGALIILEKNTGLPVPISLGMASPNSTRTNVTTIVHTTNSKIGCPVKSNNLEISADESKIIKMFTRLFT